MAKAKTDLVIVESPAKARTIEKYLGSNYQVVASMGQLLAQEPHWAQTSWLIS